MLVKKSIPTIFSESRGTIITIWGLHGHNNTTRGLH